MREQQYIDYFKNLAIANTQINHTLNGIDAFAYVDDPNNLDEFDDKLRNARCEYFMLLIADNGSFQDNASESFHQDIDGGFFILSRKTNSKSIAQTRDECMQIIIDTLGRINRDGKKQLINPDRKVDFRINDIPYEKVGPMCDDWHGYVVYFQFGCPFGYQVNSTIWRDII
ncbi:hypothetical protein [Pedobacter ginsengisoli]|uniref:hypothetical protein n=1 Tax=Pedobacter ginsengisoli TaxID=363852 RepID=UPI00254BD0C5|nr:hypothetical protein [Pedobacter ginsengisoli]